MSASVMSAPLTLSPARRLFVNVAVRDLKRSVDFFSALGFTFNPQFTDAHAACMIVSREAYIMLLAEPFFRTFTRRAPCDTRASTEALLGFSCASRAEVDAMMAKAIDAGGTYAMDPIECSFLYVRSFYDPYGHHWDVLWMDPHALRYRSLSSCLKESR